MTDNEPAATTAVALVDDEALVRAGLRMILGGAQDIVIVGEAGDGAQALELVAASAPDVVLMDIRMPNVDGIAATTSLVQQYPDLKVVVLTTFDADDMIVRAMQVGAAGFLLKDTPPERIVDAVRSVYAGDTILSASVTAALVARATSGEDNRAQRARARLAHLTDRELDVAQAVGEGLSNAQIARRLYMGVPTVKAHVSKVLAKLECSNRVQVAILVHESNDS